MGSIRSHCRRNRGNDVLRSVGIVLWRRVIGSKIGGHERLDNARRDGRRARGVEDVDVTISLEVG